MSNYSLITNTHVKEINAAAALEGATSFVSSGGTTNTTQSSFVDVAQNTTVTVAHASNTTGRLVQVYELQTGSGLYQLQDVANYAINVKSATTTTITKLSAGTANIKVNILLS